MWRTAIEHARIAQSKVLPLESLFVESAVYEWKATFEVSISAFYVGSFDEGRKACLQILDNPLIPEEIKELTEKNLLFYEPQKESY